MYQHGGPLGTSDFGAPPRGLLELEADFRVVTWAQRGTNHVTGASTRERLTIEQHVVDLERVVRAVRLRLPDASVWLYGHSWGVPLTLSLAARRPELVSGLVLSDGFISAAQKRGARPPTSSSGALAASPTARTSRRGRGSSPSPGRCRRETRRSTTFCS